VPADDGWRAYDTAESRAAVFCRLEHVVRWSMRGGAWGKGPGELPAGTEHEPRCAACDAELGEERVVLVRHRGLHRIADAFCSADHMTDWAKSGGRYAP
jgi:hypothetical protein